MANEPNSSLVLGLDLGVQQIILCRDLAKLLHSSLDIRL